MGSSSQKIRKLWDVVTNAGKLRKQLKSPELDLKMYWTPVLETSGGRFYFSDLQIVFTELGKYQFIFIIDGVESKLSDVIEIVEDEKVKKMDSIISYIINSLLLICGLFIISSNVGVRNVVYNINAIIFIGIMVFCVAALSLLGKGNTIAFYVTISLILLMLCEVLVSEMGKTYGEISNVNYLFFF